MSKVWMDKRIVDAKKASISVFDRGFMYGDGVFETMRAYAGVVFKIDAHMARLERSLKTARIKLPYSKSYLKREICKLLAINKLKSAYIRLTVTRGEGRFGIEYKDVLKPHVVIVAKEFSSYPDETFRKGISCRVVSIRQNDSSPLANIKSLNFMSYIMARFEAKDAGCDEAILLNTKGRVAEAVTSNVFIVKGNSIVTPSIDSGALPGITRGVVIGMAKRLGMRVVEKPVSYRELLGAREVFLTNSLAEVLSVVKVGRKRIGHGIPGDITKLLRIAYQKEVIREVLK